MDQKRSELRTVRNVHVEPNKSRQTVSREADGDDGTQRAHEPDRYEDISTSNDAVKLCATVKDVKPNRINGFARE